MSEYVTDEAVEKAARALHDQRSMRSRALHELGQPLGDTVYDNERRADARVALEAAVPSIVAQALRDALTAQIRHDKEPDVRLQGYACCRYCKRWLQGQ